MAVKCSVKPLEKSQIALTVTLESKTVEEEYGKRLAKYAKEIQLNGFRKGKAPVSVIENKFGETIRNEVSFDCMEKEMEEAIKTLKDEEKPLPYSTPVLQDEEKLVPFKKGEDITFTVNYDVMPTFTLPAYTGLTVSYTAAEVSEKDIDSRVEELRQQNAMVIAKDGAVEKGDIVTCNYVELDKDGAEVSGTSRKDFTFTVGSSYNFYAFDDEIVGMKKDEEKKFEKTYAEDYGNPSYAGKTITLLVKITEIKVRQLPEVDDEFAEDVKEEYKSVKDMRAGIKADMQKDLDEHLKNDKLEALIDQITKEVTIEIPESMVKAQTESNWRNYVRQTGLSEEQLEQYFKLSGQSKESVLESWAEPAAKDLKGQLVLSEIQKKENFPVDDAEVEKRVSESLKEDADEDTKKYYTEAVRDELQFAKVVPFLLEKNTFKAEKTLSYEEYHTHAHSHEEE